MIVTPFRMAADGIARETALLEAGQPALLLWQAEENALVVPSSVTRQAGFEDLTSEAAEEGWPVTVRSTGGGIVPQGKDTLNLAMIVPCSASFTLEEGYRLICGVLAEALTRFEITTTTGSRKGAFCDGDWNVLADGRKLAGTAQRWRATLQGRVALIHAAILTKMPECALWPVLRRCYEAAMPEHALPEVSAHVALDKLMPGTMNFNSFPGALVRAAEDRLTFNLHQKRAAA